MSGPIARIVAQVAVMGFGMATKAFAAAYAQAINSKSVAAAIGTNADRLLCCG
jgi:hypothetical protein